MNKIFYILLIFAVLYFGINNFINKQQIDLLTTENASLASNLNSQTTIYKDKVIFKTRVKEKVVTVIKYLPPESHTTITTNNNNETKVDVQSKGFCIFPAVNGIVSNALQIGLGARIMYWDRYGLGVGLSNEIKPYVYIDRRISDFIPFLQNSAVGISYNGNLGFLVSVFL